MSKILIKNGHVVDPANKIDAPADILIENGKIVKLAKDISVGAEETIDARDRIVLPGLVDMHVHLREPGREDKETIASGTLAAAAGGVTTVLAMPNTHPAIDLAERANTVKEIIKRDACVNVLICGAITKDRAGVERTDIASLKKAGVAAISDDGSSVDNQELMSQALKQAKKEKVLPICHCEDTKLSAGGVVNLGLISTKLGLKGFPKEAEYKRIERDIALAKVIRCPIHIAHVSCRESLEIIAKAKAAGVQVTAEVTPHHFALSDEAIAGYDTNTKMNPPLRGKDDLAAIKKALQSGTIDVIASDHAPHTENEKEIEFDRAEFGVIGLETTFAVSITELVKAGILSWPELVTKLAWNPAKILNLKKGTLSVGCDADIAIVDPGKEWVVEKGRLLSKSKNCAFLGRRLFGKVVYTLCAGQVVYRG